MWLFGKRHCYFYKKKYILLYYQKYLSFQAEAAEAEADLDWWSKYYASGDPKDKDKCAKYLKKGMDKLKVTIAV